MKKQFLTCLFLLVFLGTQAQTKEETVAYINKLVSDAKPPKKSEGNWSYTLLEQTFLSNSFTCKWYKTHDYTDRITNTKKTDYLNSSITYKPVNYKYLIDSFKVEKWDESYTSLILRFSVEVVAVDENSEKITYPSPNKNIQIIIPTDKVNNAKRALLHLKELVTKEKDLFDNK